MRTFLSLLVALCLLSACSGDEAVLTSRRALRTEDVPKLSRLVREDRNKLFRGVQKAEATLTPLVAGYEESRAPQLRRVLTGLHSPPRGIAELVGSPLTFLAVTDATGKVIVRDGEAAADHMHGMALGEEPVVRDALAGRGGIGLVEMRSHEPGQPASPVLVVAWPLRAETGIVGTVITGMPLWRVSQRLTRQIRFDQSADIARGRVVWVYIHRDGRLFHQGSSPEIDSVIPHGAAIDNGLRESPKGFTDELFVHGRAYGYGVIPMPSLGEGTSMIVARAEAP
jgi:hypothetical protein